MFWNKKEFKPKPKIKGTTPKSQKQKEPSPKWQPPFNKNEKVEPEISNVSEKQEEKIDWEDKFLKSFRKLTYSHRAWDVWRDYVLMFACAISNATDKGNYEQREKRYMEMVKNYSKEEQMIFPELTAYTTMALEENPEQDFLGKMFMRLNLGNRDTGQIFTPYSVCELMAEITAANNVMGTIKKYGYLTLNDMCCGAGATLIAGAHAIRKQLENHHPPLNFQNYILVVAQDIDEIVGLMCYIQISLLGLAGFVKIGDSIIDPITMNNSLENYWYTPMYFSNIWITRRNMHYLDELFKED